MDLKVHINITCREFQIVRKPTKDIPLFGGKEQLCVHGDIRHAAKENDTMSLCFHDW